MLGRRRARHNAVAFDCGTLLAHLLAYDLLRAGQSWLSAMCHGWIAEASAEEVATAQA